MPKKNKLITFVVRVIDGGVLGNDRAPYTDGRTACVIGTSPTRVAVHRPGIYLLYGVGRFRDRK